MTDAPDTTTERLAEYEQLFGGALVGRDRLGDGIRFRFRAEAGIADHVRDLAAREKACCAFFSFAVTETGDEVWWDVSVVDDPIARQILDEYYRLPDTLAEGALALHERFANQGLDIVINDGETLRAATKEDLGLARWPVAGRLSDTPSRPRR